MDDAPRRGRNKHVGRRRRSSSPRRTADLGVTSQRIPFRRRPAVMFKAAGGFSLVGVGLAVVLATGMGQDTPAPAQAADRAAPPASAPQSKVSVRPNVAPTQVTVQTYFKQKDPGGKTAKRVDEVTWSGDFLRVYTNLAESEEESKSALSICEWTAEYLQKHRADKEPVVFVQAKSTGKILANKSSARDSCKLEVVP